MSQNNELFGNKNTNRLATKSQVKIQKKSKFSLLLWRYVEIFNCYLLFVTACDNTLHCTQRQLTVLTLCLPREVRADGT
jgi:hypothetical protein